MAKRPTMQKFRKKALKKPEVRAEYDALTVDANMLLHPRSRPPGALGRTRAQRTSPAVERFPIYQG